MPKKILCAVDGSHAANHAAGCAAELAKGTGAKLIFVTVNTVPLERAAEECFWDETLLSAVDGQVHAQLAAAHKEATNHGLSDFGAVILSGTRVASTLISYAKEKEFDHIVMGTGTTNELQRLILGSVATDVVSHAHCPVTIVR